MRLIVPFPFGEITIVVRKTRLGPPLFWYGLLSAALHFLILCVLGALVFRAFVPLAQKTAPPVMVSISSALRVEHRTHPAPAHHPMTRPRPALSRPRTVAAVPAPQRMRRRELSKPARVAYAQPQPTEQPQTLTPSQIEAQTRMFERTIAMARSAADPVAGSASNEVKPSAPKPRPLNISGEEGRPQPEGVLYPLKRWTDGPYVYYYVRYDVIYADGGTESGMVPWPIRFPLNGDPFARGIHRMPLPGPQPDYVLPDGVSLQPLVKNCFDHRYEYCPIEREPGESQ